MDIKSSTLSMKLSLSLFLALSLLTVSSPLHAQDDETYDLVIYGGTSAAVAAAVQAKRMDLSVIIVSPDIHLGGLSSGGLGWTDSGKKEAVGGVSREFYQRIKAHYDKPEAWVHQKPENYGRYRKDDDAMWVFEPKVAEQVFEDFVKEYDIPVINDAWLDRENGVELKEGKIQSITTLDGKTYRGSIFMDTTYEGDLMASAGVSYATGREANSVYGETLNGIQKERTLKHQFTEPISAYKVPGDPSSGLLPRISAEDPGVDGEGDHRVQAYNFRMCLTKVGANRVPFPKPEGYDPAQYELLARFLKTGWGGTFNKFDPAPNFKTDTNNHGPFSTDNIGMNYDYPDATYERRKEIIKEHEQYQQGLMYFMANDPSVPEDIRKEMSKWGLAKDEFLDNGHWPHQIYVREARRMVSDFVMSELHLRALEPTPASVGMGSYNMDSHNTQRYVTPEGNVRNEGDIQVSPGGPYPISYLSIVPKKEECTNLLVPVCVSSSHIAFGSIRMEPVFMILGQSATTAAALALEDGIAVQDVDYDALKAILLKDGQVLEMERNPRPITVHLDPKKMDGVVLDDSDAELTGSWTASSSSPVYVGPGYLHDGNVYKGKTSARWEASLDPGSYEVRISCVPNANRASNVPVTIVHADGTETVQLNQKKGPDKSKELSPLGTYRFDGQAVVVINTQDTDGYVIVDGIQFLPAEKK